MNSTSNANMSRILTNINVGNEDTSITSIWRWWSRARNNARMMKLSLIAANDAWYHEMHDFWRGNFRPSNLVASNTTDFEIRWIDYSTNQHTTLYFCKTSRVLTSFLMWVLRTLTQIMVPTPKYLGNLEIQSNDSDLQRFCSRHHLQCNQSVFQPYFPTPSSSFLFFLLSHIPLPVCTPILLQGGPCKVI